MFNKDTIFTFSTLGNAGRLGNQLFQISSVLGVAEKFGAKAVFPKWEYAKYFKNELEQTLENYTVTHRYYAPFFHYTEINEQDIIALPNYSPGQQIVIDLCGYFQSEKYWAHCKEKILEQFEFTDDVQKEAMRQISIPKEMSYTGLNLTGIHFRFGDYVNNPYYANLIENGYYEAAIKEFCLGYDTVFVVCSDDIEKAKEQVDKFLNDGYGNIWLISEHKEAIYDLCLLSNCGSHIVANSSFSWWGAILNKHKNKTVIMPQYWFGGSGLVNDTKDLYPSGVILI